MKYRNRIINLIKVPTKFARFYLLFFLFLGLSLLSGYFVYASIGGRELVIDERLFHFDFVLAVFMLLAVYFLSDGLRLYFVLRSIGEKVFFKEIMKLVFINIFISNVTPLATGGGFVQTYYLSRNGVMIGKAFGATLIRTFLAVMFLFTAAPLIIALSSSGFYTSFLSENIYIYIIIVLGLYISASGLIILKSIYIIRAAAFILGLLRSVRLLSDRRYKRFKYKLIKEIRMFSKSLFIFLKGDIKYIFFSVLFTFLFLLSLFSFSAVILWQLGYESAYLKIIAIQTVVTFLMYFAPTPGASGIAEGAYSILFKRIVSASDITIVTVVWRFLTIYIGVLIGMFILYKELFRRSLKSDK